MDRGAHFRCCDFQVHTPRDRRWHGPKAVTDEERRDYAAAFVAACREKGLDAVGITDHHDMLFVPYIRAAARAECDGNGDPLPPERQLAVFPGMELTLGVPCQALLLFDADFPDDMFSLALTALAITPVPAPEAVLGDVGRLEAVQNLSQLHELLDRHEYLRGKYIVLPNVSDGGSATLLRTGNAGKYKTMPCVGGYVDGAITRLGTGNQTILNGRSADHGHKVIGVFQTSDNRRRDFADLGAHPTWVKWAAPTAEALRQACLARESRIAHVRPYTPTVVVSSVQVSNSKFMGPVTLGLNPQYNALIGGRGTGKSTLLEYLRWGLCDEPAAAADDSDEPDHRSRRRKLIERTLAPFDASVQVDFSVHGVSHTVRRSSSNGEVLLKIADAAFEPVSDAAVRALLPVQAYSQKQLSSVGVRVDELKRFVHAPVRQALDDTARRFGEVAAAVRAAHARVRRKRALAQEAEAGARELRSLGEQVQQIRATLEGVSPEDQATIDMRSGYDAEVQLVAGWTERLRRVRAAVDACAGVFEAPGDLAGVDEMLPNTALLTGARDGLGLALGLAVGAVHDAAAALAAADVTGEPPRALIEQWRERQEQFRSAYDSAVGRSSAHERTLAQLADAERRASALRTRLSTLHSELEQVGHPEDEYATQRTAYRELHFERFRLVEEQCAALTVLSGGLIRARLERCSGTGGMTEKFRAITAGTNLRGSRVERMCEQITTSDDPLGAWFTIADELEALAEHDGGAGQPLLPTPALAQIGFTDAELRRIASKLTADTWLDLSLVVLEDRPVFEYRSRESEYIPFADASAGQQATALLWALLNQEGPPLIIDQPEDDLDNQVMQDVVRQLWAAKGRRQLVFSSHNANLVVNGDAELVACCGYRVQGEQSSGTIVAEGAIDIAPVRSAITGVMEGGQRAFTLRKDKYGF